jgi:hypothetical protein
VDRILAECKKSLGVVWRKERSLQVIATCRNWTPQIDDFAKFVPANPTMVVSSGFEVLAYCKIPPMVHMLHSPHIRSQQVLGKKVKLSVVIYFFSLLRIFFVSNLCFCG